MLLKKFVLGMTTAFVAVAVQAHEVWLEPDSNPTQYRVKFGHKTTETYPQSKLKAVKLLSQNGTISDAVYQFQPQQDNKGEAVLTLPADTLIVYTRFDNGVWSKLPSGKYVEKTKKEAPEAEFSMNPVKLGKAVIAWNEQTFQPHNMTYELVPQAKPEAGKPLPILVLKNGKPVAGIKVGLGEDEPFSLTNDQGIAEFTPTVGFNKVWAEFEEKVSDNPDYTERSFEYVLTFDVAK